MCEVLERPVHQIHISDFNTKLGSISNISLPPGETCQAGVPCGEKCYAKKFYKMYPTVREAWDENLLAYKENYTWYFNDIITELEKQNKKYFRWHVSGDVPDKRYFIGICFVAEMVPGTKFLLYTRFPFEGIRSKLPSNLIIVKSYWNGFDRTYDPKYPGFIAYDKNILDAQVQTLEAKGIAVHRCSGSCSECYACWNAKPGMIVVNAIH